MARKYVELSIKHSIEIGNVDVTFRVRDGATHLGDLTISRGGVDWRPSRARAAVTKAWAAFGELMAR